MTRLADQLTCPPGLADLAAEAGLSRYQLLRSFRAEVGMPPYAWLAQHRVARARLLLDRGHRPAEAAALAGFADQAHLTRWFRRVVGVTPGAYAASVHPAPRAQPDPGVPGDPAARPDPAPATRSTLLDPALRLIPAAWPGRRWLRVTQGMCAAGGDRGPGCSERRAGRSDVRASATSLQRRESNSHVAAACPRHARPGARVTPVPPVPCFPGRTVGGPARQRHGWPPGDARAAPEGQP